MKTKAVIIYISDWLKQYALASNASGFIVGISGGIDSAVTSVLAARTGLPLICMEMPIHQNKLEVNRSLQHIKWLKSHFSNIRSKKINLTSTFDEFIKKIPSKKSELALANTRARLRMTTLYYFAQANNYLVTGTGNKVEDFGIGFFTKYGDGGVDISPIADLLKSEVYIIGKELGIINEILNAPPTDGLWGDNKTDEEQIGATYPELEWAMDFSGDLHTLSKRQKEVIEIYTSLNDRNQHKMIDIPICKIPTNLK